MAHKNKVVCSINLHGEHICVDVALRPDDVFGFDEFRRDPQDLSGQHSIGRFGDQVFSDADAALEQATVAVHLVYDQL